MAGLDIPNIQLTGGVEIPQLGLGVFQVDPGETSAVVADALELGYRHIDTAKIYDNEAEVGAAIAESSVSREDLFVTTKLWNSDHLRAEVAFAESLERLGLDFVDLYLVHWPQPQDGTALEAWRGLIRIAESGRARAIGVSNFEVPHLQQIIDETGVVPAVNQIELHPLHQRRELRAFCAEHGIAIEAWSPLAQARPELFDAQPVREISAALGRTPAQVVLRWHVQRGTIVFPKTVRRERMLANAQIFDFVLDDAQMSALDGLNQGRNFGPDPMEFHLK